MPRVLIAGCGYTGEAAADLFSGEGWEVEGWTGSPDSAKELAGKTYPVGAVDIADAEQVCAQARDFDAIIHCASTRGGDVDLYRRVYWEGARNLLAAFAKSKIIFVSSTSVYAQTNGEWVTEESLADPSQEKGRILRETETLVLNSGGTVARFGGIYGPGRSALLKRFQEGKAMIDPDIDRFVNQVHRDDCATALFLLLNRRSFAGEIFNVVDDQPLRLSECYRWLAKRLNRPLPPGGQSGLPDKRGRSNKRVSNAKLRELGWEPHYPCFAEAMEKSIFASFGIPAAEIQRPRSDD
jgi:nucleoside-diphosphate-sugar epimerase